MVGYFFATLNLVEISWIEISNHQIANGMAICTDASTRTFNFREWILERNERRSITKLLLLSISLPFFHIFNAALTAFSHKLK